VTDHPLLPPQSSGYRQCDVAEVLLSHHFDAAHRLPQIAGGNTKCNNLHGHTWRVVLGITGPVQPDMTVVEFGSVKSVWRAHIDTVYDHATLLGQDDPLLPVLAQFGMRLVVFGQDGHTSELPWPSVEAVTAALVRTARTLPLPADCYVSSMHVTETDANAVQWRLR
jgi:6-pyruvoyl-tetrahydropterin synthase